ncbi:unnamed protein product [Heligmosomoides polygyrus]|uniref:Reverse transcriptase domain-containing protein n=1 Tax=Heligmosomoides polygyrus TaxID=6339 RepID=A0A183FHD6_HELPZ|nr:unnamed protein product [Heligmosomoides polygyrus]
MLLYQEAGGVNGIDGATLTRSRTGCRKAGRCHEFVRRQFAQSPRLERRHRHKYIEETREYTLPVCLTFIDRKKAFDSVETAAVVEALLTQDAPTQYISVFRELYSGFTTKISPFYNDVVIDVKRGVRQGGTIYPKLDLNVVLQLKRMFMRNGQFCLYGTNPE